MDIPYKVNFGQETPDEPHVGWYYGFDNEEGDREIAGPFASRIAAEVSQKNNPRVPNNQVEGAEGCLQPKAPSRPRVST